MPLTCHGAHPVGALECEFTEFDCVENELVSKGSLYWNVCLWSRQGQPVVATLINRLRHMTGQKRQGPVFRGGRETTLFVVVAVRINNCLQQFGTV